MVDTWTPITIDGKDYIEIETARFRVPYPFDPSSKMFIAVAAPGTSLADFPAIAQGDPGESPTIDTTAVLTALAYGDVTPDSAAFTEISPGVFRLAISLHKGAPGVDGTSALDPTDYGTPVAKKILVVTATADGFEYATQKVGDRYYPASIASAPSGNANYTLSTLSIPAQGFDWHPRVRGYTVVTGTGANVQVDLLVRLNDEVAGNIVGRATQPAGQYPATHTLCAGPPAGSAATYDKVSAGSGATLYLRTERQSGTDTYTTAGSTSMFSVEVQPIP